MYQRNNEPNAFLLNEKQAQKMGINNNENFNINNENDKNDNKDNNENTYCVLVKDITTKKNEYAFYIPLFSALEETAENKNFTYSIEIIEANTTEVTNMNGIFSGCWKLQNIEGLKKLDITNVKDISNMFYECKALTKIIGIDKWDTDNVTDMSWMFSKCEALTTGIQVRLPIWSLCLIIVVH